jgi:hypothetical protein
MRSLSVPFFTTLLVVLAFFTLRSFADLPVQLAVHFRSDGTADRWATREHYRSLIFVLLVSAPLILVWIMAGLPRLTKGKGQIPYAAYWFADEHRKATSHFLLQHACWLGSLTAAAIYGLHILITRANTTNPPSLATNDLFTMVFVYLIGLAWWLQALLKRFRR